ncbi:YheC/YheD family protein [Effusibacillus dendaii]|uniref:ATP-grasp domain-containing protein n=1 Tax=Effusibacillus dendaii TaxID=2743772 RepID=A0A7I8D851_9BACL|nr:YheC/YheD family protein [Effusibacillus dendaii]BCJ86318.1 hypothetical protein skT53_13030 [Effusibacillus dendaii]
MDPERGSLNKWEMYKALQGEPIGPCQLPVTHLLTGETLRQMLKRFTAVYVKPAGSWGGNGISVVKRLKDGYSWQLQGESEQTYVSIQPLAERLTRFYQGCTIVQQAIDFLPYQNRPFDVRIHMQREADWNWVFAGSLARIGGRGSIVSNVLISRGAVEPTAQVLASVYPTAEWEQIEHQLIEIGYSISLILEEYRLFYEIGIDVGVDPTGTLWLIEVNTDDALGGPSHQLFAELPDRSVYDRMIQRLQKRQQMRAMDLWQLFFSLPTE